MHISIDQNNANKMLFYFYLYDHENNANLILWNVLDPSREIVSFLLLITELHNLNDVIVQFLV